MTMKRTVTLEGSSATQVAKRLRKVERLASHNKPEMRTITFSSQGTLTDDQLVNVNLTNIAQGNSIASRNGDRIRVWRVEVRGLAAPELDHYLFQLKTTSEPTIAVFGPPSGAFLVDSETNSRFVEWKHYRNLYGGGGGGDSPLKYTVKWKNGMIVRYNGTTATSCVNNGVLATVLNRSGNTQNYNLAFRLWYTDA